MARLDIAAALAFCLPVSAAMAGTSQSSFTVGIVIGQLQQQQLRYTWGAAAISLTREGYRDLRPIEAAGEVYWFMAWRAGARFRVAVEAATGRIAAVIPL